MRATSSRKRASMPRWVVGLVVAALGLIISACGGGGASTSPSGPSQQTLIPVRVVNVPVAATEVLAVAQQEGFFKNHGLDVTVTDSNNIATFIPGLGKQWDIVMATPTDFLNGILHGYDLVAIPQAWEDAASLIAPKDITSPSGLSGKKIGVPSLAGLQYGMVSYSLQKLGVNNAQLTVIPFPNQPAALNAGQINAADVPEPYASLALENSDYKVLFNPTKIATGESGPLTGWYATSKTYANQNPQVIKNWEAAIGEAMAWIPGHSQAYRQILVQALKIEPALANRIELPPYELHVKVSQLKAFETPLVATQQVAAAINNVSLSDHLLGG